MKRCPQPGCNLAGDSLGNCGNRGGPMPCPRPVEVKRATDVVIHCEPCAKTWGLSVTDQILKRGQSLPRCVGGTDRCRAVVVPQEKAAAK